MKRRYSVENSGKKRIENSNEKDENGSQTGTESSSDLFKKSTGTLNEKIFPWIKARSKKTFTKKILFRRLPILNWLPKYNSQDAIGDIMAGITVGLMVIPQALAYSNIAGLPAEYGLYGSFMGCFVYMILGSCREVPVGPTAIISLLTFQAIKGNGAEYAILLCFLSGIVMLLMGFLGLGFLIDFVSDPVSSGFTSAAALIIFTSQVKDILGINASGSTFIEMWTSIAENIHDTSLWDCIMGFSCILILFLVRYLTERLTLFIKVMDNQKAADESNPGIIRRSLLKCLWILGTSRNAIIVVSGGLVAYILLSSYDESPIRLIGEIPSGLPTPKPPAFSVTTGNSTASFLDMVTTLETGIAIVPLLALLENIAICKAFANGKPVDATQELLAIGTANIVTSFFQGYPVTGALSRSAVNNSSGVRTPLSGLYTGILVILSLLFLTPYFYYIPRATLAAVIIAAVVFMIEVKVFRQIWRTKKSDLVIGLVTFISCLVLALEWGILIGIGCNLLFILYYAARPKVTTEVLSTFDGTQYLMISPDRCLIFPAVDYVRNIVTKHSLRQNMPVVLDCSHIYGADYTAAAAVEALEKDFAGRDQLITFYNLKPSITSMFQAVSTKQFYVCYSQEEIDNFFKEKLPVKENA